MSDPTSWRTEMMRDIKGLMKPKFLTVDGIRKMAQKKRASVSESTIHRWINEMEKAGFLRSVRDGLYANLLATPTPIPDAAASLLRHGAIVSLNSALREAGVDNNPSAIVTAIIPVASFRSKNYPKPGEFTTSFGRFRFYTMPAELFSEQIGRDEDLYDPRKPYRLATPEKAILDWIYISSSSRIARSDTRRMAPPHMDLDMEEVNLQKMMRMADKMGISDELDAWLSSKREYDADDNVRNNRNMGLSF
jgi:hypothetical protein